ncbi:glycosyltransferase [uncultured Pontibacter sp.]|uniref:glycosyltransferase n=1 Tax=uncultured Pontibacter sp. TaxID=453356 RepID=UPI00262EE8EB|nr:glycosyltransferase [uncultured Pontibacter sp.]
MIQQVIQEKPLVSIIVVTYNSSNTVVETLDSIKHQTYSELELIVSDDCSNDNTVQICRDWFEENAGRFVRSELVTSLKNTGIAPNFNRGLAIAQGEWIKTIAGDDAMFPNLVEAYIDYIETQPEVKFLHSNVYMYKDSFKECNRLPVPNSSSFTINKDGLTPEMQFQILLRKCQIWAATVMIKSEIFKELGYFDESIPMWEDRPMWLKITKHNIKLTYLNIVGAKYRICLSSVQKDSSYKKVFSNFDVLRGKVFYKRYIQLLPTQERILKKIKIKRMLFLDKLGLNRNTILIKIIIKITNYPLNIFINRLEKRNTKF